MSPSIRHGPARCSDSHSLIPLLYEHVSILTPQALHPHAVEVPTSHHATGAYSPGAAKAPGGVFLFLGARGPGPQTLWVGAHYTRNESRSAQDAPPFDQGLVGKQLEVLWRYFDKDTNEPLLIWATGRVARVADGLTDTRSSRAKKLLPAGMVLWEWDADAEFGEKAGSAWLHLLPQKWNKQLVYS